MPSCGAVWWGLRAPLPNAVARWQRSRHRADCLGARPRLDRPHTDRGIHGSARGNESHGDEPLSGTASVKPNLSVDRRTRGDARTRPRRCVFITQRTRRRRGERGDVHVVTAARIVEDLKTEHVASRICRNGDWIERPRDDVSGAASRNRRFTPGETSANHNDRQNRGNQSHLHDRPPSREAPVPSTGARWVAAKLT